MILQCAKGSCSDGRLISSRTWPRVCLKGLRVSSCPTYVRSCLTERKPVLKKAKVTKVLKEGDRVVGVDYEKDGKHVSCILHFAVSDVTDKSCSLQNTVPSFSPPVVTLPISPAIHCSRSTDLSTTTS